MNQQTLISFLLPKESIQNEQELYFRGNSSLLQGDCLRFNPGDTASFDTFFNSFEYSTFRRYSAIESINFVIDLCGEFDVEVIRSSLAKSQTTQTEETRENYSYSTLEKTHKISVDSSILSTKHFSSEVRSTFSINIPIGELRTSGYIYLKLTALSPSTYYGGEVNTDDTPVSENIKIGTVICTYKREKYVKANVKRLLSMPESKDLIDVFVIDNGGTLTTDDVNGATLVKNKNLGGSGGFTRGIIEVTNKNAYSHILLMDDDILFDPEIIRRTLAILRYAINPTRVVIGASMLHMEKPYLQHEFGAVWLGTTLVSHNNDFDIREKGALIKNCDTFAADYTAWWFNCFPVSFVEKFGLPLPLFIKGDDIEYGLRANADIILTNGIGVWHERFESKYSAELEYYIKRNEAIINALYNKKINWFSHFKKLVISTGKQLTLQRYFAVDLIFKAYKDFLRGAKYFNNIDAEKLHSEIRSVVAKQQSIEELLEQGIDIENHEIFKVKKLSRGKRVVLAATLNGYLLPSWTYNKHERRSFRLIDMTEAKPNHFFRAYRVVQYNPETKTAFVTHLKVWRLFHTGWRLILMFFSLLFKYRKAANSYKKKMSEITSLSEWENRLGITN